MITIGQRARNIVKDIRHKETFSDAENEATELEKEAADIIEELQDKLDEFFHIFNQLHKSMKSTW